MSRLLKGSIDCTKINKSRLKDGKYLQVDIWINDEPDQYGKDFSVVEGQTKEESEAKAKKNYIGSGWKKFGWGEKAAPKASAPASDDDDSDVPF